MGVLETSALSRYPCPAKGEENSTTFNSPCEGLSPNAGIYNKFKINGHFFGFSEL